MSQSRISSPPALGPFKLVTVNRHKNIAQNLMGQVVLGLKEDFTIIHVANVEGLENLRPTLERIRPDILGIASSWKPDESTVIKATAIEVLPDLRAFIVPHDILAEIGPSAVKEFCRNALIDAIKSIHS